MIVRFRSDARGDRSRRTETRSCFRVLQSATCSVAVSLSLSERCGGSLIPFVFSLFCYAEEEKPFGVRAFLSFCISAVLCRFLTSAVLTACTTLEAQARDDQAPKGADRSREQPDGSQRLPRSGQQQQQPPLPGEVQGDENPGPSHNVTPHSSSVQNASGLDAAGNAAGPVNPNHASPDAESENLVHETDTDTPGQTNLATASNVITNLFRGGQTASQLGASTGAETTTTAHSDVTTNVYTQRPASETAREESSNRNSQRASRNEPEAQVEKLRISFLNLKPYTLDSSLNAQASSARRYQSLANAPLDSVLTVTRLAEFDPQDGIKYKSAEIKVIRKTGVTWHGQPVAPEEAQVPIIEEWAVSKEELESEDDTESGGPITAGLCPVVFTSAESFADIVSTWSRSHPSEGIGLDESFFLAFRGPAGGTVRKGGRPGIPLAQSVVLQANKLTGLTLEHDLRSVRAHMTEIEGKADKAAAYIAVDEDSDGLWMTTAGIPLPEGHGIPGGFSVRCDSHPTLTTFMEAAAKEMKCNAASLQWMQDPLMEAWFRAVNSEEKGQRLATSYFSASDPIFNNLWVPTANFNPSEADYRLLVQPMLALTHQIFLDWFTNEASSDPMRAKYKRFVDDAMSCYTAPPAHLGTPTAEGATFLFTLFQPRVKTWQDQFPFKMFRSQVFLAPYISAYSKEATLIPARGANSVAFTPKPLLSPIDHAKRRREDENSVETEPTMNSADLMKSFFTSGVTPPSKPLQQFKRARQSSFQASLFSNKDDDGKPPASTEQSWPTTQTASRKNRENTTSNQVDLQRPPTGRVSFVQQSQQPPRFVETGADDQQQESDSVQEVDPPVNFDELPVFSSSNQDSEMEIIPAHKHIYPQAWRTPSITRALALMGQQDYFNADDVKSSDDKLKSIFHPIQVDDTWGQQKKESKEQPATTGAFDPIQFSQSTLPPFQSYVLFACASRPANPNVWKVVTCKKNPTGFPSSIQSEDITFPGFISPEAYMKCIDQKHNASPQSAIDWITSSAHLASTMMRGPVKAKFNRHFRSAIGRVHLFKANIITITEVVDPELCWSAMHWMQSAHDHQGTLRIPTGGYSAKTIRETVRNIWWFHHLLVLQSSDASQSSFSLAGLLSDKLIRFSTWIEADSKTDEAWSTLSPEQREKMSAQIIVKLSDLFDVFIHWMHYHPKSGLTRCCFYQEATRRDLFVLKNTTISHRTRKESISVDLMQWQDDFDKDFSESYFKILAQEWPVNFPNDLKPTHRNVATSSQRPNTLRFASESGPSARASADKPQQYHTTEQSKDSEQTGHQQRKADNYSTGEFKIAEIPSFRLVKEPKMRGETGAFMNFGKLIQSAQRSNPDFPSAPTIGKKQFCFRFMTARCGCNVSQNPRFAKRGPCDKIHFDLKAGGDTETVSNEKLQEIIAFVRTAPFNESIEPTPELLARAKK